MALDEYRKKRDFNKSPEPAGTAPSKTKAGESLFFCVQKHLASHLHYDLRLEWNGVLLSWAVPKGPSIDTRDKRLAMHVEDHPVEYGTFEGVIPEGYGAGIVLLWDQGTWEPETDDVDAALKKGDLKFRLNGFKLKGSWVLVRTRGYQSRAGASGERDSGRSWLLIKHKDEWAGPIDIAEFAPLSVKTADADFAEILSNGVPDVWHSNAPAKGGDTGKLFQSIIARALEMTSKAKGSMPKAKGSMPKAKGSMQKAKAKVQKTKAKERESQGTRHRAKGTRHKAKGTRHRAKGTTQKAKGQN